MDRYARLGGEHDQICNARFEAERQKQLAEIEEAVQARFGVKTTMANDREVEVGGRVIWHDAKGQPHNALVTTVWSKDCLNVVFVSGDDTKKDGYGRQTEHATSCQHKSLSTVHGYYWRFEDEEPNPYVAPAAV